MPPMCRDIWFSCLLVFGSCIILLFVVCVCMSWTLCAMCVLVATWFCVEQFHMCLCIGIHHFNISFFLRFRLVKLGQNLRMLS